IHASNTDCGATAAANDTTAARALGDTSAAIAATSATTTTASATSVRTRKKLVVTLTPGTSAHAEGTHQHSLVGRAELHTDGHLPLPAVRDVVQRCEVVPVAELLQRHGERREILTRSRQLHRHVVDGRRATAGRERGEVHVVRSRDSGRDVDVHPHLARFQ